MLLQDSWFVREYPGDASAVLFGVFDGHGPHGQQVANSVVKLLPNMLVATDAWQASATLNHATLQSSPTFIT